MLSHNNFTTNLKWQVVTSYFNKKKKKKSVMDRLELLTTYDFLIKKNGPVMCAFKGYICALRVYITIYEKLKRPWKKLITFSFFYKKFKKWFTNNEYHKSSQKKKKCIP